jgi:hypothetical protein
LVPEVFCRRCRVLKKKLSHHHHRAIRRVGVRVELRLPPQVGLGQGLSATPYIKGGGARGTPRHSKT